MTINDEILSAFLDNELTSMQMDHVRQRLAEDESLALRLSEMAMVDQRVSQHYDAINHLPVPDRILALLEEPGTSAAKGRVLAFPARPRLMQALQQHAAAVAGVCLLAGFVLAQLLPSAGENSQWNAIADVLDSKGSGQRWPAANGQELQPRLTFANHAGQYCRQYQLSGPAGSSENIACRTDQGWVLQAMVPTQSVREGGSYRTASGGSVLDPALDLMIAQSPVSLDQEAELIDKSWSISQ
ncbi:MAG TPA: hypothetical protein ENI17_05325 [Pseudomonas xinjiangensis]|uniref:Anti-sigma factor n=2 Tax=root TaxID=1 RepID=A0A7V1BN47_9GAMM|nr:hypothetical protein [Halopseudomonas xinjiangensis]HEC47034.1 hypothetical protein [Halopseudomonas xinjiangensis]